MERRSNSVFLVCLMSLALAGCCNCDPVRSDYTDAPASSSRFKDKELKGDCRYIKEEIASSKSFAKRMANSRYAIYYQASSWERISELEKQAKEMGCK